MLRHVLDHGRRWRIGTSFGWVHVRLRNAAEPPELAGTPQGKRPHFARFLLRSELSHNPAIRQALAELAARLRTDGFSGWGSRGAAPSLAHEGELSRLLESEVAAGRLELGFEPFPGVFHERDPLDVELPPLDQAPPPPAPEKSFIAGRLIDQNGKPIVGQRFVIELPDKTVHRGFTDPQGFARVVGFIQNGTANITFPGLDELDFKTKSAADRVVMPIGNTPEAEAAGLDAEALLRDGEQAKTLADAARKVAGEALGSEREAKLGQLFVELFDKSGRVRHAERAYRITGPQSFEGRTDAKGRLLHREVEPGDYTLTLTLDFFTGDPDATVDVFELPLVVLDPAASSPQVRLVGALPRSILANLRFFFNTNKTFLLPTALPSVRKLRRLYTENAPCQLLVVGHADTRGDAAFNDELSLARAEATIAYLKDDVDAWLAQYSASDAKQRWGKVEDHLMLIALPDYVDKPQGEDEVSFFQRTRGLKVDGMAGDETRRALITEYMSLDGASLRDSVGEIEAVAHGCGEHFPLDDGGKELDRAPPDQKRDRGDRRVELFFFDREFGITPKPPGDTSKPNGPEYPLWRQRVQEVVELRAGDQDAPTLTFAELTDAHFRTSSAVVLPQGENPDDAGKHEAFTAASLIGVALRFNQENPGRTVLVAGHTDSAAEAQFNQPLSEERAEVALALLKGGEESREVFKKRCHARHENADINQILSWVSRELADFEDPAFDCNPGRIGEGLNDAVIRRFQAAFNAHRAELGSTAAPLVVDGSVGELTWGAFFDCYEFALRKQLGEDAASLTALREKLVFADPDRQSLGFGERYPVEELGVDNFRSQTNRRVEILFIPEGVEPDLARAQENPDAADIYLPGRFERTPLDVKPEDLAFGHVDIRLHVPLGVAPPKCSYRLFASNVGFDAVLPSSAATRDEPEFMMLRFTRLDRKGVYGLEQVQGASRLVVFENLPFEALRAGGNSKPVSTANVVPPRSVDISRFAKYSLKSAIEQRG